MSSSLPEAQQYLDAGDDKSLAEALDRRCRAYGGMGPSKPDKVTLTNVAAFKPSDNLGKLRYPQGISPGPPSQVPSAAISGAAVY